MHIRVRRSVQRGLTLTELMITMLIVAAVMALAVPGFQNVLLATRLTNYANELVGSVYSARGEAIKRNIDVRLCATSDGATCAGSAVWAQGWLVLDPNDLVLQRQEALDTTYSLAETGGAHTLTFDPTGFVGAATSFKVCRQNPVGGQERQVTVSTIGRTNVDRTTTGTCP